MLLRKVMLEYLNGMFWDKQEKFNFRYIGEPKKVVLFLKSHLPAFIWNSLATFEDNPITLSQITSILGSQSVGEIRQDDLLQVRHFLNGVEYLVSLVLEGAFRLDEETACAIHALVGKEEALEWGVLRDADVTIQGASYLPPNPDELASLMKKGFQFLDTEIEDPVERAVAIFLFMSRSQFFFDANKRTSTLMMNGILLSNGYYPLTVLKKDAEAFYEKLARFYETGNANEMFAYFANLADTTYQGRPDRKKKQTLPNLIEGQKNYLCLKI